MDAAAAGGGEGVRARRGCSCRLTHRGRRRALLDQCTGDMRPQDFREGRDARADLLGGVEDVIGVVKEGDEARDGSFALRGARSGLVGRGGVVVVVMGGDGGVGLLVVLVLVLVLVLEVVILGVFVLGVFVVRVIIVRVDIVVVVTPASACPPRTTLGP